MKQDKKLRGGLPGSHVLSILLAFWLSVKEKVAMQSPYRQLESPIPPFRQIESIILAINFIHSNGDSQEGDMHELLNTIIKSPMYLFISGVFSNQFWSEDDTIKLDRITDLWLTYIKPWNIYRHNLDEKLHFPTLYSESEKPRLFIESQKELYDDLRAEFLNMASTFNFHNNRYALPLLKKFLDGWEELNNFPELTITINPKHVKSIDYAYKVIYKLETFEKDKGESDLCKEVLIKLKKMFPRETITPKTLFSNSEDSLFEDDMPTREKSRNNEPNTKESKKILIDTKFAPVTSSENGLLVKLLVTISKKLIPYYGSYTNTRLLASIKFHFWLAIVSLLIIMFLTFVNI